MTYKENSNTLLTYSGIPCYPPPKSESSIITYPRNAGVAEGYYAPVMFTPPGEMTGRTLVYDKNGAYTYLRGMIAFRGYLYFSDTYGTSRKLLPDGPYEFLFRNSSQESYSIEDESFIISNDKKKLEQMVLLDYMYNEGNYIEDWEMKIGVIDVNTREKRIFGDMPQYINEDEWFEITYYFSVLTPNNRLVISSYSEVDNGHPDGFWDFNFYIHIYDFNTGELLYYYASEDIPAYYMFQYPVTPPVTVGNKVYIEYHFGASEEDEYDGEPVPDNTPIIMVVDTENLSVETVRPKITVDGYTRYLSNLYQAAYDSFSQSIVFIYERVNYTEAYGDDAHYGIMLLNVNSLNVTFPWEVRYSYHYPPEPDDVSPTDLPGSLLVAPDNVVYLLKEDGTIVSVNTPTNTIITIPMNNYRYWSGVSSMIFYMDYAQPNKICNIIDENGVLWMCYQGNIYGYNLNGDDPIIINVDIPEPSGGYYSLSLSYVHQLVYLLDGKLFILQKSLAGRDGCPYGWSVWMIDKTENTVPSQDYCRLRNTGNNRPNSSGYGVLLENIYNPNDTSSLLRYGLGLILKDTSNIYTNWVNYPTTLAYSGEFIYYQIASDVGSFKTQRNYGETGIVCIQQSAIENTSNRTVTVGAFGNNNFPDGICLSYLEKQKLLVGIKTDYDINDEPSITNPIYLIDFSYAAYDWQQSLPESSVLYATVDNIWSMLTLRKSDGDVWVYVNSYRKEIVGGEAVQIGYSVSFQNYTQNSEWTTIDYDMDGESASSTFTPFTPCFIGENYLTWVHSYYGGRVRGYALNLNTNLLQTSASAAGTSGSAMRIYSSAPENYSDYAIFTTKESGYIRYYPGSNSLYIRTNIMDGMALSSKDSAFIIQVSTGKLYLERGPTMFGILPLDSEAIYNNISNIIGDDGSIWWFDWKTKNLKKISYNGTVTQIYTWSSVNYGSYSLNNRSTCILAGSDVIVSMEMQATSGSYAWYRYLIW